ncbi:MAG: hypothetical protein EOO63_07750, partial [Hymenobacter sp.]
MRKFLSTWVFALALLLAAGAPAWALPGVVNLTTPVLPANAGRTAINSLSASSGTPTSYNITSLPGGGTLYVNGATITAVPRSLTPTQAAQLSFQPSGTPGNYSFKFNAVDGNGTSSDALYVLSVGQPGCSLASGFDFSNRAVNESWKAQSVAVGNVTIATSDYAADPSTDQFQIARTLATIPATSELSTALTWDVDYNSSTASTSQVTFTFSQPLLGFSIVVQDIDAAAGFTDQVQFDGYTS